MCSTAAFTITPRLSVITLAISILFVDMYLLPGNPAAVYSAAEFNSYRFFFLFCRILYVIDPFTVFNYIIFFQKTTFLSHFSICKRKNDFINIFFYQFHMICLHPLIKMDRPVLSEENVIAPDSSSGIFSLLSDSLEHYMALPYNKIKGDNDYGNNKAPY